MELQSGGSELGDPSCLPPPGSVALDAHFQGRLKDSVVEFDRAGNRPTEPRAAAAKGSAHGVCAMSMCMRASPRIYLQLVLDL